MPLLRPGDTCWRIEQAGRAAFLIDYQAYYVAVLAALRKARRSIILLGWSFDPRTRLMPDGTRTRDAPDQIGLVLLDLQRERPDLDIRILAWRSSIAISATQEFFPHKAKGWFADTGIHFHLDDTVPFGACHHQKVLVIDDCIAFSGSGDIAVDRWDSPAHQDSDARRLMPSGRSHGARHEVMMLVDGPAAVALGELCRDRWRQATGESPPVPSAPAAEDPWPEHLAPDVTDCTVGISRTAPAWRRNDTIEENLRLTLAAIARAERGLYIENQYFTAPAVAEALAQRLAEPDGPEVVLVSTRQSPSWFDQATMDRARTVLLWRLQAADIFGRLRAFYPATPAGDRVIVHSKAMVIDDTLARVGSANLNNRSGGFDTECDLAVEAETAAHREAIGAFRNRLVGHWVGRDAEAVAEAVDRHGGLIGAMDALNRHGRLRPIPQRAMGWFGKLVTDHHLGDPATAADSWRPLRRREQLYQRVRDMAQAATEKSTTSGR
jgi:phosphatidylserine/phosphatidylglycerophosphate/cardiolipin synthase-like enzyme